MKYAVALDGAAIDPGSYEQSISVRTAPEAQANVHRALDQVVNAIGRPLRPKEDDWLDLLCAVHLADLLCPRGLNEDWNREIDLAVRLREPENMADHLPLLEGIFRRLTHDTLKVRLDEANGRFNGRFPTRRRDEERPDAVYLVSGGVDSATSVWASRGNRHPVFVSSATAGHVIAAQRAVITSLGRGPGSFTTAGFRVLPRHDRPLMPLPHPDITQRSRTLLFTGLAAAIAATNGLDRIVLGENGVMAINCPLTAGRVGGFTTHTAHPDILRLMSRLFAEVHGTPVEIVNPLELQTKTEVVRDLSASRPALLGSTHSCWIARTGTHCGRCVPCIVRRFAVSAAGVPGDVTYSVDLLGTAYVPGDSKWENAVDYLYFVSRVSAMSDDELLLEYPELNLEAGIPQQRQAIEMHRRWAEDVLTVARASPGLGPLA